MKKLIVFALLAAAVVAGCTENEIEQSAVSFEMVEVRLTTGEETRTALNADNSVAWETGDKIRVWLVGGHNYEFTVEGTPEGNHATFVASIPAEDAELAMDRVVYPANYANIRNWSYIVYDVPIYAEQPMLDGTFAKDINPAAGVVSGNSTVTLQNIAGLVVVPVQGDAMLKSVNLLGNNGEKVSGTGNVSTGGATPAWIEGNAPTGDIVSLVAATQMNINTTKNLVFVVNPNAFTKGITLQFIDAAGKSFTKSYPAPVTLTRAGKVTLATTTLLADEFVAVSGIEIEGQYTKTVATSQYTSSQAPKKDGTMANLSDGSENFGRYIYEVDYTATQNTVAGDFGYNTEIGDSPEKQKYAVNYNQYGLKLYFDISTVAMPGKENCVKIINLRDRVTGDDLIYFNASYVNVVTGEVVFDIIISGASQAKRLCVSLTNKQPLE